MLSDGPLDGDGQAACRMAFATFNNYSYPVRVFMKMFLFFTTILQNAK